MNPKLEGSNLIDCVPQSGPCPHCCPECFYNTSFYAGWDPVMPSLEEADGKIVRVNSGNDSNHHKGYVIEATAPYEHKFYNTSQPDFEFPGPVVFTCNGQTTDQSFHAVPYVENLMAVRVRVNTWNLGLCDAAVDYYSEHGIRVILTFMRYADKDNVKIPDDYVWKTHVSNDYWSIESEKRAEVVSRYSDHKLVYTCGTRWSSLCRDCRVCETLYWKAIENGQATEPNRIRQRQVDQYQAAGL